MNEPKRLRQQGAHRMTTVLLEAARTDAPPKARLDRMLGIGGSAGAALAAGTAGAAVGAPVTKSAVGIALVIKWLGLGAVAGAVVGASATQISPIDARETSAAVTPPIPAEGSKGSAPAVAERLAAPPALVEQPATNADRTTPAPRAELRQGLARARAGSSSTAPRPQTAIPTPTPPGTSEPISDQTRSLEARVLREEILALGRAKAALNRGAVAEALAVIREYRARFPVGRLGPEATYIEMEAEHASGNRARAGALAEQLASGAMPNAERARAILKGGKP